MCNSALPVSWFPVLRTSSSSCLSTFCLKQCFIFHSKKGPFNTSLFAWLIYLDSLQDAFSSGNFQGSKHIKLHPLDLKQIDCQVFLFRISRELQFRVCNNDEPCPNLCIAGEREHFYRGEKEVGGLQQTNSPWLFTGSLKVTFNQK